MGDPPPPVVRKTKKSCYKPLSQLNQDRLHELTRMERPEHTRRLFYYGLAGRTRLRNNLNVWLRHHQHSLALLQRHQRAVQHRMGRMHQDVRRTRRDDYKRRQQEIRDKLHAFQVKLLQRRVVQKFQSNAVTKMAARGEQSLVALWMARKPGHVTGYDPDLGFTTSTDLPHVSVSSAAGVTTGELSLPDHQDDLLFSHESPPDGKDLQPSSGSTSKNGGAEPAGGSHGESHSESGLPAQTGRKTSVRRFSESDVRQEPGVDGAMDSPQTAASPGTLNDVRRNSNLHIIPEDLPFTDDPDTSVGDRASGKKDGSSPTQSPQSPPFVNSRALEVRKNRPQSPKTHSIAGTRRATLGVLPHTPKLKTLSPIAPNVPQNSLPPQPDQHSDRQGEHLDLNPLPVSSTTDSARTLKSKPDSTTVDISPQDTKSPAGTSSSNRDDNFSRVKPGPGDWQESKTRSKGPGKGDRAETDEASREQARGSGMESGAGREVFAQVPSRAQVLEDMGRLLGQGQEGGTGRGTGAGRRGSLSLAARVKRQRKMEAVRRSEQLDKEPLVQYYCSVRGTLEPLLTEPSRKSFPFPSGRPQYEQHKMLREEQQKDLDRRQHIDNFFNTLFNRQTKPSQAKPAAQDANSAAKTEPKARQRNLLFKLRAGAAVQGLHGKGDSLQQLAGCQYLRLHDWEAKNTKDRPDQPVTTSWATAEKSLKAGFLALNLTGSG